MSKFFYLSIMTVFISIPSFAVDISPLAGINMTFGGDPMAYVTFTDGSKSDLQAGRGLTFFGGASFNDLWSKNEHRLDVQTTLGIKFASTKAATNGEITFIRWPLEAIAFYRNSDYKFRAGTGLAYHFSNKVSGTGIASSISADVDNALGFVVQADYLMGFNSHMAFGLRYENVSYDISGQNVSFSGSNFGFQFTYMWKSE